MILIAVKKAITFLEAALKPTVIVLSCLVRVVFF